PPARRILEKGGTLALATDFNPGSSATQNLPLMTTLACVFCKLTVRQALWAATLGGACALRLEDRLGSLESGKQADLVIWNCDDERQIPYYFGMNLVEDVFKAGRQVVKNGKII
ncbi:MAG TPA: imidazolonepropionase, partial [Bacteroidetes bacterium]|nr:imidazolonepropionase [Bacteroidota bacterium]